MAQRCLFWNSQRDYGALDFWRKPVKDALSGKKIRVIDTEEHGILDRFAALDLLNWGINSHKAAELPLERQMELLSPLVRILERAGYHVRLEKAEVFISNGNLEKETAVYPAMWTEPVQSNKIYISDACLKYARPYAVQKIMDSFLGI